MRKQNIFQRIGNSIEKRRKEKERIRENYWKLSPLERIDYDQKLREIERIRTTYFDIQVTKIILFLFGFSFILLFLLAFGGGYPLGEFFNLLRPNSLLAAKYLLFGLGLDILIAIISLSKPDKELKELNKRFKLC